jgi:hypothetical protein
MPRLGQDEIGAAAGQRGFHFGAHENGECLATDVTAIASETRHLRHRATHA